MLIENFNATFHEQVVVGLVAGSALQLGNACAFCNGNPNFWYQNPFKVKSDDALLSRCCNCHVSILADGLG